MPDYTRYKFRPCPVCKKENRLPEGEICGICERDIVLGQQAQAREAERNAAREEVVVRIGQQWKYDKRLVNFLPAGFGGNDPARDILTEIVNLSGGVKYPRFTPEAMSVYGNRDSHTGELWVGMSPVQAEAAQKLLAAIAEFAAQVAANATWRAETFLVRLAAGEISFDQLQDQATRK